MDFKQYYRQQELMEFDAPDTMAKVATAAGKAVGGALGLIGKAIKAGYDKTLGKIVNELKMKGQQAIEIAKKVYPYDAEIYARMQKEGKLKDIKEITSYLSRKKEAGQKAVGEELRSKGLTLVYEAYANAFNALLNTLPAEKKAKAKMSMQSLKEAAEQENIKFQKFNDYKSLREFIDANETKIGSMLNRWIVTASLYSKWKNMYDNTDEENPSSFVSEILNSNIRNRQASLIDAKIQALENKGAEVNITTLENEFERELQDQIDLIMKEIKDNQTLIKGSDEEIDEVEIKDFLRTKAITRLSNKNHNQSNTFITTKKIINENGLPLTVAGAFSTQRDFMKLFSPLGELTKTVQPSMVPDMMTRYFQMNGEGIKSSGNAKMKEGYVKDIEGLKILFGILTTGKAPKENPTPVETTQTETPPAEAPAETPPAEAPQAEAQKQG